MNFAFKPLPLALTAFAVAAGGATNAVADTAVINFTTDVQSYEGPSGLDPFFPGSTTFDLFNGTGSFTAPGSDDWTRITGQIYIDDFGGDGTYTVSPTGGGAIYLHSALLNRIEAISLRTEGPLTQDSLNAGAGRQDGANTQNRDDIYLPDDTPNGTAEVTISGNEVTIDYLLDFTTLPDTNAAFLRDGTTATQIGDALVANNAQFGSISIIGTQTAVVQQAVIGSGDEDSFPYGGYYDLDPAIGGNLANTIIPTTRGLLDREIAAGNISSDGRSAMNPATVFLTDPFASESGNTFFFDLNGGPDFVGSVVLVPEPASGVVVLLGAAAACSIGRRRRL